MGAQEIIVAIIGIVVVAVIVRKFYRIFKGKDNGCPCCGGKECHCHDGKCHCNEK